MQMREAMDVIHLNLVVSRQRAQGIMQQLYAFVPGEQGRRAARNKPWGLGEGASWGPPSLPAALAPLSKAHPL